MARKEFPIFGTSKIEIGRRGSERISRTILTDLLMKSALTIILFTFLVSVSSAQGDFFSKLSESAITLTHQKVVYDPKYYSIQYPNGDVPSDRGVCTDVVIRSYRKLGIDLQKEVHEDMKENFSVYPKIWGLKTTDKNIDHRRVPNLMKFFERHDAKLTISDKADDYKPGDVVCWNLGGAITHIGIVVDKKSNDGKRNLIVHNIGGGQVLADCLFEYKIIGHYRYIK
jgi:uncharacterized protein